MNADLLNWIPRLVRALVDARYNKKSKLFGRSLHNVYDSNFKTNITDLNTNITRDANFWKSELGRIFN